MSELKPLRTLLLVTLTAFLFTILSVALGYGSLLVAPRETVNANIAHSFQAGQIDATVKLPLAKEGIPAVSGNDCLILAMMVLPYDSAWKEAVSPYLLESHLKETPGIRPDEPWTCGVARLGLTEPASIQPDGYYHRYLHGYRTVMRTLLGFMDVTTMQVLVLTASFLVPLLLLVLAGRDWLRSGMTAPRPAAYAALAAILLVLYGLPLYGWWTSYALGDLVAFLFLLVVYRFPLSGLSDNARLGLLALFGCLTAWFDFLTGGLLIGACLVAGVVALDYRDRPSLLLPRLVQSGAAFVLAAGLCFAFKIALAGMVFGGDEAAVFGRTLTHRFGGSILAELSPHLTERYRAIGLDPAVVDGSVVLRIVMMGVALLHASFGLAYGSTPIGAGLLLLAAGVVLLHLIRLWRSPANPGRCADLLLAGSVLILPCWYLLFVNHSILHAIWMVRPLVWLLAVPLMLTVMWRVDRRSRLS